MKLEPMFQLTKKEVADVVNQYIGNMHDDRFSPDDNGQFDDEITEAIAKCFDAKKFNALVPKLYYPTTFTTITKQDLLDYLNDWYDNQNNCTGDHHDHYFGSWDLGMLGSIHH